MSRQEFTARLHGKMEQQHSSMPQEDVTASYHGKMEQQKITAVLPSQKDIGISRRNAYIFVLLKFVYGLYI